MLAKVSISFNPDFSKVDKNVFLEALGQAFFSLSLGTACLCTYASYFSRQTNLMKSAFQVAVIDTLVAICGPDDIPAAFSVGVNPGSGPSLVFITLPNVFSRHSHRCPSSDTSSPCCFMRCSLWRRSHRPSPCTRLVRLSSMRNCTSRASAGLG